jgi:predicted metal-dependent TIM-barrel fold hydrolase
MEQNHIMIKSSAEWGISDPLSVPLVAREMRKAEFSNNDFKIQIFYNAYEFYKLSPRMTWNP